ncbi:MAG: MFS transporter [Pseudomonadota bacterium]
MTDTSAPFSDSGPSKIAKSGAAEATGEALGSKGIGWAVFEWARNPYYNVIVIYVFAPYFANYIAGGGAAGQATVADTIKIAGMAMAILAPLLGLIVDKGGGKKSFIFVSLAVLGICSLGLGYITPDFPNAVTIGMTLMIVGYCAYTVSEILHNSILPAAGKPAALPMISGLGLAFGNVAGVIMLLVLLAANVLMPIVTETTGGIGVYSGPIVAFWLAVFIIPFFILMPDRRGSLGSWPASIKQTFTPPNFKLWGSGSPFNYVWSMPINSALFVISKFKESPNVMRYLAARMIYADGMAVLLTLGGVYVAGVLGWSATEVIIYGITGSLLGALGGIVGGALDGRLGPKNALIVELIAIIIILFVQVSVTQDSLFFGLVASGQDIWTGFGTGLFTSLSDVFYFLMVIPAGIAIVSCISSSRYMLVHISPPERIGEFFGFYAMAGSITVWIGPLIVSEMTTAFDDQRIGFSGVAILFVIGLLILLTVKADKTPEHMKPVPRR